MFDWVDEKVGPNKAKYPLACQEARNMVSDCVINSECFKVDSRDAAVQELPLLHGLGHRQALQGAALRLLPLQAHDGLLGEESPRRRHALS